MGNITGVPVRATIDISSGSIIIKTPFILSFSVNKQRGAPATFNASVKVSHDNIKQAIAGGPITIDAGTKDNEKRIFTGSIQQAQIKPCFDDPNFVNLNISGSDILGYLAGKKFTRRCRAEKGQFAVITSVVRPGLKSKRFTFQDEASGFDITNGDKESETPITRSTSNANVKDIPVKSPQTTDEVGIVGFDVSVTGGGA
jgi:hypothetical protein